MDASRIEIITSMNKFTELKAELSKMNVTGMTVMQVLGCGAQKGTREYEVTQNMEFELLPKEMIIIIVENQCLDKILDIIKKVLYTGHIGDGKIFVSPITNVIRIRTGEEGADALY